MVDSSGRQIDYMRISITDRCNLRCKYCMPNGIQCVSMQEILTFEEIITCVKAAASLGITCIKLTGGEPLVRRGCVELVRMIKQVEGIEKVTLTTNGVLLSNYLEDLVDAGIDGINISLDTLNRARFNEITGFDEFYTVLDAIRKSVDSGVKTKINAVSMSYGDEQAFSEDVANLIELTKDMDIDVRFIELMPIGMGKNVSSLNHKLIFSEMKKRYAKVTEDKSVHGRGPAVYYKLEGYRGSIGFISAIHGKFCDSCNRIRLSSQGDLKGCLCYESSSNLKGILRSDMAYEYILEQVRKEISKTIENKPSAHCFEQMEDITEDLYMTSIGG